MRKILLSMIAIFATVYSANATLNKDYCLESPDEFVWVESKGECVPINACIDDKIKEIYCKSVKSRVPEEYKEKFGKKYAGEVLHTDAEDIQILDRVGDNEYTSLKTSDGMYYTIESMNSDTDESYSTFNLTEVACAAYGYSATTNENIDCLGVDTESKCKNIAEFASLLANESVSGNFVEKTSEYKSYCELE